jgi:hypothetical protein
MDRACSPNFKSERKRMNLKVVVANNDIICLRCRPIINFNEHKKPFLDFMLCTEHLDALERDIISTTVHEVSEAKGGDDLMPYDRAVGLKAASSTPAVVAPNDAPQKMLGQLAFEEWEMTVHPERLMPWKQVGMQVGWENIAQIVADEALKRELSKDLTEYKCVSIFYARKLIKVRDEAISRLALETENWRMMHERDQKEIAELKSRLTLSRAGAS